MRYLDVTDIHCPECHAKPGDWCTSGNMVRGGALLTHPARTREVIRINTERVERDEHPLERP